MNEIVVRFIDGTKLEMNKVHGIALLGGTLVILFIGVFGELDSKNIDDSLIDSYEVKVGKWT